MTPHINAKPGQIAKTVLMPGDPLRAKFIAEKFLTNVELVNTVRNVFMYTGLYKGKPITVAASGMGVPSIGIYSYELFKFYDVDRIVRIGSAGAYTADLKLYDVVLVNEAYTDSHAYAEMVLGQKTHVLRPSAKLNAQLLENALKLGIDVTVGRIHTQDVFYSSRPLEKTIEISKAIAVEMESFALFANAKKLGKEAACLLTISDNLITHEETSSEERETKFSQMMEIALELA
ncbi:purine-nucleoside phosphorylase [Mesomycoplasma lagogenitalium]|uniref:Uridine phosphorylase n=1 Tax=Mesomycoplasma lagogenitalium TaxID=171286 RepID=A0ABY8LUA5_9BACT|nr:purine-nucleoside phosphorylase [Mesomycoplasma lagogenitalium]WGI36816.1 purine-nucleoside phosphorylase [Mesomycoplasma lagogenitalium]